MDKIIIQNNKRKKYKKSTSVFPLIYMLICLFLVSIIAFALFYLKDALVFYEESRPIHIVERFLEQIKGDSVNAIVKSLNLDKSEYESDENLYSYINDVLNSGEMKYGQKAGEFSEDKPVYVITVGGKELATLYLSSYDKDKYGNNLWEIQRVEAGNFAKKQYRIVAPSDVEILVNAKALEKSLFSPSQEELVFPKQYNDEYQAPLMQEAVIDSMYEKPQITAEDKNGNPIKIDYDEDSSTFTISYLSNESISSEMFDYIFNIFELYGKYTTEIGEFAQVAQYIEPNSHLHKDMTGFEIWIYAKPRQIIYENKKMWDCFVYGDDKFSCKIYADEIIDIYSWKKENIVANEVFMKKINGKWYLSDIRFLAKSEFPSEEHEE